MKRLLAPLLVLLAATQLRAAIEVGSSIEGLAGPEDYPALATALAARGWSTEDVAAVTHGNLLRFLRAALPA